MKPPIVTLRAARTQFNEAEAAHRANVEALDRAREQLAAARTALDNLAADDEAAVARHARRLEARPRKGESGPPPALVPTDKHVAAQITAQRTHSAARLMVANLESAVRESERALATAEEALQSAALNALSEEADRMAGELESLRERVEAHERLLGACRDVPGFRPSLAVFRALRDTVNLPINELNPTGAWDRTWNTPVNMRDRVPVDASAHWGDRLAALISGKTADPTADAAAA